MKIKCKDYKQYLKAEYKRLKRNGLRPGRDKQSLHNMDELLARISNLESPEKERVFVEGIIGLSHIPSIAA